MIHGEPGADLDVDAVVVAIAGRVGDDACRRAELLAQADRTRAGRRARRPATRARLRSTVSTTSCHAAARSKSAGRTDRVVGQLDRADPVDAERAQPVVGVGDEVPRRALLDEAERVDDPRRLGARAVGVAEADLHAGDDGPLQLVEVCGRGTDVRPQLAGSSTTADAAASASARNVSGSAWTSLRSAALASGVAVDDGPATMNSVRASAAVSPLRSVRAPPISCHRRRCAGLRVHRDAGDGQRLEVAAGGLHRHLQLVGQLGGGHPAAGLQHEQGGHEAIGTHLPRSSRRTWTGGDHFAVIVDA